MLSTTNRRFGAVMLSMYQSEGIFDIELANDDEAEEVAAVLQEMGVEAKIDPRRSSRITVTCARESQMARQD